MKKMFGVELSDMAALNELDIDKLYFDKNEPFLIFETYHDLEVIKDILEPLNIIEDEIELYLLNSPTTTNVFTDYGFKSDKGHHYLYADTTAPFMITSGEANDRKLARLQIEENLIASEKQDSSILFVDRQYKKLIEGYANAYNISVTFL